MIFYLCSYSDFFFQILKINKLRLRNLDNLISTNRYATKMYIHSHFKMVKPSYLVAISMLYELPM